MKIKKILTSLAMTGITLSVIGCGNNKPEMMKVGDLTGDGITDVLMHEDAFIGYVRGDYLFVGKGDGSFIRTREKWGSDVKYFLSDEGDVAYFFDGEFYKPSKKVK